ncbi:MAG: hypothetical protein ACLFUB_05155 [Cyclobacteriaceae bacterium]
MKNTILFFLILFTGLEVALAKVITVDNNAGTSADYASLSEAVTAASNGDSIYVHASQIAYGNLNLNKSLAILGPGHYPETNPAGTAILGDITLLTGSSGSIFSGLSVSSISVSTNSSVQVHDILIENNLFRRASAIIGASQASGGNSDNWIIRGNVFLNLNRCGGCTVIAVGNDVQLNTANENWFIYNNLIDVRGNIYIFNNINATATINHNIIITTATNNAYGLFIGNSNDRNSGVSLSNNIFISTSPDNFDLARGCSNCSFTNNLTYHPVSTLVDLPGTGNLNNTDPEFVNVPESFAWSYEHDFNVTDSSPANNAGTDGTDLGIYGGTAFQFTKFGYPQGMPYVEFFQVNNPQLQEGENLNISIRARVGN